MGGVINQGKTLLIIRIITILVIIMLIIIIEIIRITIIIVIILGIVIVIIIIRGRRKTIDKKKKKYIMLNCISACPSYPALHSYVAKTLATSTRCCIVLAMDVRKQPPKIACRGPADLLVDQMPRVLSSPSIIC